jgi:hypothetical protein
MRALIALFAAAVCTILGSCGGADSGVGSMDKRAARAVQAAPPTLDTATLLNWAPAAYPQYFNGASTDASAAVDGYGTFAYRYWPATGNYVGVLPDGGVYVFGPVSANQVSQVGTLQSLTCAIYDCGDCSGPSASSCNAATTTALNNALCTAIAPFSFEVGDSNGARLSKSRGGPGASDLLAIASASEWIYAAYVVDARGGVFSINESDINHLHFTSGYTNFGSSPNGLLCPASYTVDQCLQGTGGARDSQTVGRFDYDSGHMERHASGYMSLGSAGIGDLTARVQWQLGGDISLAYVEPNLASGIETTTADYARMLRKILAGRLGMHGALGINPVCTNASVPDCNAVPGASPMNITGEAWHYSMGHWVEDDPQVGDGAFSSVGTFGFYPWIDKSASYYGVVARESRSEPHAGVNSALCGRLIRRAWFTGVIQTRPIPG